MTRPSSAMVEALGDIAENIRRLNAIPGDIARFRPGPIERKGADMKTTRAATRERVSVVEPPQEWYEAVCAVCAWRDGGQHSMQVQAEGAATWHAKKAQHAVAVERVTMVGVSEALGS